MCRSNHLSDFSVGIIKEIKNSSLGDGNSTSPDLIDKGGEDIKNHGEKNNYNAFAIVNLVATIIIFAILQSIICLKKKPEK